MRTPAIRIFLSSTFTDLERHRAKVREMVHRLEQATISMETFGARPGTPLGTCRQNVLESDALVVIVGHRCGWIPGAQEGGDGEKSITRLEVEWALDAGKPVYAFLVDPTAPWHEEKESDRLVQAQSEDDPVRREQESARVAQAVRSLVRLRDFLEKNLTRELFASEDDLAGKVATSLANWIREQQAKAGVRAGDPDSGRGGERKPATPISWSGSPFPGLRPFTPLDAPIFFGRRREIDSLVAKLCDSNCRFLLVAGASGSGKSSLVAAGLIPRLSGGAIAGSEEWLLPDVHEVGQGRAWIGLRFTPGEQGPNPFQALATRLAPMLAEAPSPHEIALALEAEPGQLPDLIEHALDGRSARAEALLFVDQFEELVTTVPDLKLQGRFVDMLGAAARSSRIRIVSTVRSDFWHRCLELQPSLADLLRDCGLTVPLAVPGHSALVDMMEGPASCAGLRFDEGLVDELADQSVSRPGGLALLAFTLHELYQSRTSDGLLSRSAYERFGGLAGVIDDRAEATFARLPQPVQTQLGAVFSRLVIVDDGGVATRQRAHRDDVVGVSAEAASFVKAFEQARLLVSDRTDSGAIVLEVAHEALLREWPLLAHWIRERADDLRLLQQAEAAAREWQRQRMAPLYLWPQERLLPVYQSMDRLGRRREDLQDPERSFLRFEWEWLIDELERPGTTHQRRAAIGERLDRLGDPRPGVGLDADGTPDIVWCPIPGGSVELENVEGRFDVAPFSVAKYPVTYRQYAAFLADPGGYRDLHHWQDLERAAEPGEQYRAVGNHPAENVSWYDAVAFCRWLSNRLGRDVRLPHESEWQQAATGGDTRNVFPWGASWDSAHANTLESRLNRTIAVGMYPRGASPQGGLDFAGNILEWCFNSLTEPRSVDVNRKGPHVRRGGSWGNSSGSARAAHRRGSGPGDRDRYVGFRVVCVSPIS